mgnify:CR=1 FL=1
MNILEVLKTLWHDSGFSVIDYRQIIMIAIACGLLYLAIAKKFEPSLLVGIGFGMLLTNLPGSDLYHASLWNDPNNVDFVVNYQQVLTHGGLLDFLYIGVKTGIYPCLIFIGIGAMTDFGPMIARPSSLLLGAAAQIGIYIAFFLAKLVGFNPAESAAIAIIGGADGPMTIWLTKTLAPELLAPIAIAAYSYMALIPMIQPPVMRLLTTQKERMVAMKEPREVSKLEKIIFPIVLVIAMCVILPSVAMLMGCFMLGNLLKECGVTQRLSDTAQNGLLNVVTIFLGISVGATAHYETFLTLETISIIALGLIAFAAATAGGVLLGKFMYWVTKGKVNPLIGAAGVSAMPMAARVVNAEGRKYNPDNYLLMHAMGPNVAGGIGSAIAAGIFMALFG